MGWNFPLKPEQASEHSHAYDALFNTILGLTTFFTLIVLAMILTFAIRYRRGTKVDRSNPMDHNTLLEVGWSVIPLCLALGIFAWSTINFMHQRKMPEDATEIYVIGKRWMWHLQHMNGIRENNELHVPVGKPVKMTMISQDVIHAMYLPEMRAQYHVIPGRYTNLHFTPTKPGKYLMLCAMHCGTDHSEMVGTIYVMSQQDYAAWLEKEGNRYKPNALTMEEKGHQVWQDKQCGNCHTSQDTQKGPSLMGIAGTTRRFTNSAPAVADDDYLRDSIVNPYRQLTQGYEYTMPAYKGQLSEEQVLALVHYIKSMTKGAPGSYKAPHAPTSPSKTGNQSATDVANKKGSAGASQFEENRNRP